MTYKPDLLRLFTDGAYKRHEQKGGSSFVAIRGEYNDPCDPIVYQWAKAYKKTTSNRCELLAGVHALDWASRYEKGARVVLYTDSQYLSNMYYWLPHWYRVGWVTRTGETVSNLDLVILLWKLFQENLNISNFVWLKGHTGHHWNERAHKLAESVLEEGPYQNDLTGVPLLSCDDILPLVEPDHINRVISHSIRII